MNLRTRQEFAVAVKDEYHNHGIRTELLSYHFVGKRYGLLGFTARFVENKPMLPFEKMGFDLGEAHCGDDGRELEMLFGGATA